MRSEDEMEEIFEEIMAENFPKNSETIKQRNPENDQRDKFISRPSYSSN